MAAPIKGHAEVGQSWRKPEQGQTRSLGNADPPIPGQSPEKTQTKWQKGGREQHEGRKDRWTWNYGCSIFSSSQPTHTQIYFKKWYSCLYCPLEWSWLFTGCMNAYNKVYGSPYNYSWDISQEKARSNITDIDFTCPFVKGPRENFWGPIQIIWKLIEHTLCQMQQKPIKNPSLNIEKIRQFLSSRV